MDVNAWLATPPVTKGAALLTQVNERLTAVNLSITPTEARKLAELRAAALDEAEYVEFSAPPVVAIAEAIATSPFVSSSSIARDLAQLQALFYTLRSELPADVPDAEIVEALRACLDEQGNANGIASLEPDEIMRHSPSYAQAADASDSLEYRIVDDEGRIYSLDSAEWDYDELADGWNGERWADDWND